MKPKNVFAVTDEAAVKSSGNGKSKRNNDYSDIDMLSNCPHSVAVANAINECKAVAKYICGTNENDGVAKWLEERILI